MAVQVLGAADMALAATQRRCHASVVDSASRDENGESLGSIRTYAFSA